MYRLVLGADKLRKRGVEFEIVMLYLDISIPEMRCVYTNMTAQAQFPRYCTLSEN